MSEQKDTKKVAVRQTLEHVTGERTMGRPTVPREAKEPRVAT